MDVDEVRRKRIRLFGLANSEPAASASPPKMALVPEVIDLTGDDDDVRPYEQYTGKLHTNFISGVTRIKPKPMSNAYLQPKYPVTDDERFARDLQQQYDAEHLLTPPAASSTDRHPTSSASYQTMPKPMSLLSAATLAKAQAQGIYEDVSIIQRLVAAALHTKSRCCNRIILNAQAELLACVPEEGFQASRMCPRCNSPVCIGCGERCPAANEHFGPRESETIEALTWHCDKARLVLIWALLCRYDTDAQHNKPQVHTKSKKKPGRPRKKGKPLGIGYGGSYGYDDDGLGSFDDDNHKAMKEQMEKTAHFLQSTGQKLWGQKVQGFSAWMPPTPKPLPLAFGAYPLNPTAAPPPNSALPAVPSFGSAACPQGFQSTMPPPYHVLPPNLAVPALPTSDYPLLSSNALFSPGSIFYGHEHWGNGHILGDGSKLTSSLPDKPANNHSSAPTSTPTQYPGLGVIDGDQNGLVVDDFCDDEFNSEYDWEEQIETFDFPPPRAKRLKGSPSSDRIDPDDKITVRIMTALTLLLPSAKDHPIPTAFDFEPAAEVSCMLLRSSILDRAAALLRNDSLDDAIRRLPVYNAAIGFVRALASHCATNESTIHNPRTSNGQSLVQICFQPINHKIERAVEASQPLIVCLENLNTQAGMMLDAAKSNEAEFTSDDSQQLLLLCRNICDLTDFLKANAPSGVLAEAPTEMDDHDKDAWQKDIAVLEVPDETILASHHFAQEAGTLVDAARGRMKTLIQDLTRLKTGLPPGIFVRYGSSRIDVMKIIITGPRGSPYENGLFEFDLLAPAEFPQRPPKMQFKTTGGGIAHFNPNLYPCGKICLSLLGTWSGPHWQPGKSTLLQVLVSIQAMIFCEEPYCNEPGWSNGAGTDRSESYNRNLYHLTVKHAMLGWLEDPQEQAQKRLLTRSIDRPRSLNGMFIVPPYKPHTQDSRGDKGVWDEVRKKHFDANQQDILTTVTKWVQDVKSAPRPAMPRRKGKGKLGKAPAPAFYGTGWAGLALGDYPPQDTVVNELREIRGLPENAILAPQHKMRVLEKGKVVDTGRVNGATFTAQLHGALKELEQTRGRGAWMGGGGGGPPPFATHGVDPFDMPGLD